MDLGAFSVSLTVADLAASRAFYEALGFEHVRSLQAKFKAYGLELLGEVDEGTSGPGSFMLRDPDGNVILFDQHVGLI